MARNSQVVRQWRLWCRLSACTEPLSAAELARELAPETASARTVRRDLEVLREVGVPIRVKREGREVLYSARGDGPDLRLDRDGILALRLALGLLRPFEGTPVGESLAQLVTQLEARLPAKVMAHFASLVEHLVVRTDVVPSLRGAEDVFLRVREALAGSRVLEFDYAGAGGSSSHRRVHPQALVYGPRGLYLLALDEERSGALRTFRLERMRAAKATSEPARRDGTFDPQDHLAGSLGVFSPEHEPRAFRLRVHTDAAARALRENPLHASQRLVRRRKGGWDLTLELTSSRELVTRVLAFGADLEVLEPEELRKEVGNILARAASRYPDRPKEAPRSRSRSRSVRRAG